MTQVTPLQSPRFTLAGIEARHVLTAAAVAFCGLLSHREVSAQSAAPSGCQPPPQVDTLDPAPPINIGLLKRHLVYYRCTAYDDDVRNALGRARGWIARHVGDFDRPAIVLDIDETSLSNWEQIYHNDFAYIPSGACDLKSGSACGQREWELSASAAAIQPTLELFNLAKSLKGKDGSPLAMFFITGRYDDPFERLATEWNLRRVGYDQWQQLYMRPDATRGQPVSVYKMQARADIEDRQRFSIIANIGDQLSDLVGGHAQKCFKVPNPFYFIPGEPVPPGGLDCLRTTQGK
jgi:hypothetical protein